MPSSSDANSSEVDMHSQMYQVTIDFEPKDVKFPVPYYQRVPKHVTSKKKSTKSGAQASSHAPQSTETKPTTDENDDEVGSRVVKKQRMHCLPAVPIKLRDPKSNVPTHRSNELHTPKRKRAKRPNTPHLRKSERIAARKSLSLEVVAPVPTPVYEAKEGEEDTGGNISGEPKEERVHGAHEVSDLTEGSSVDEAESRAPVRSRKRKSLPASSNECTDRPARRRRSAPLDIRRQPLFPNLVASCRPLQAPAPAAESSKESADSFERIAVDEVESPTAQRSQRRKSLPAICRTRSSKNTSRRSSTPTCTTDQPLFPNLIDCISTRCLSNRVFTGPIKPILKDWDQTIAKEHGEDVGQQNLASFWTVAPMLEKTDSETESISSDSTIDSEELIHDTMQIGNDVHLTKNLLPEDPAIAEAAKGSEDGDVTRIGQESEELDDEEQIAVAEAEAAERRFNGIDDETEYMRNWLRNVQRKKKAEAEEAPQSQEEETMQEDEDCDGEKIMAKEPTLPLSPNREVMWPKDNSSSMQTGSESRSSPRKRSKEEEATEDEDELSSQPTTKRRTTRPTAAKALPAKISIKRQDGHTFRLALSRDAELAQLTTANTDSNRGRYKNKEMMRRLKARGEAHVKPRPGEEKSGDASEADPADKETQPVFQPRKKFSIMRTPEEREEQELRELRERDRKENEGLERVWAKERLTERNRRKSVRNVVWDETLAYFVEDIRMREREERERLEVERAEKEKAEERERKRAARRAEREVVGPMEKKRLRAERMALAKSPKVVTSRVPTASKTRPATPAKRQAEKRV